MYRQKKHKSDIKVLLLLGLVAVGLAIVGVRIYSSNFPSALDPLVFHPKAKPEEKTKPSNPIDPATPSPAVIPAVDTPQQSPSKAITVITPTQGSVVSSGTKVTGTAQVFEGTIQYRLKTLQSGVVAQGTAQVTGDSTSMAPFSFELTFDKTSIVAHDQATLEVYSLSAKDGTEINKVPVGVYVQ